MPRIRASTLSSASSRTTSARARRAPRSGVNRHTLQNSSGRSAWNSIRPKDTVVYPPDSRAVAQAAISGCRPVSQAAGCGTFARRIRATTSPSRRHSCSTLRNASPTWYPWPSARAWKSAAER